MNRRDAIKSLVAMPGLTAVQSAVVAPNDVIVLTYDGLLNSDEIANLTHQMNQIWPNRKVIVLDKGLSMRIVRQSDAPRVA